MPITTITTPPSRNAGLSQDAYSAAMESTLNTIKTAVDDINANASQYNVATSTTSTSSVLIGTGSKTFTVPAALGFVIGMTLRIANTSANFMTGEVTSYVGTSLVMNITAVGGSGTFASWSISMAAVGANSAASVINTPAGNISATTVQAAINELDTEKLSSAAGAVSDTNLNIVATGSTVGDSFNIPVVTFTSKGRVTGVSTAQKILQSTPITTTSGTSHPYTSLSSSAKRFTFMLNGVSSSGTSVIQLQFSTGGVFQITGYNSSVTAMAGVVNTNSLASGVPLQTTVNASATATLRGAIRIMLIDGFTYVYEGTLSDTGSNLRFSVSGDVTLGGLLDGIRMTTVNGTDTFDLGKVNLHAE